MYHTVKECIVLVYHIVTHCSVGVSYKQCSGTCLISYSKTVDIVLVSHTVKESSVNVPYSHIG